MEILELWGPLGADKLAVVKGLRGEVKVFNVCDSKLKRKGLRITWDFWNYGELSEPRGGWLLRA